MIYTKMVDRDNGGDIMAERIIDTADLSYIERNLNALANQVVDVSNQVYDVNTNVVNINDDLQNLRKEFYAFVERSEKHHNEEVAQTRLVEIRQQIEKKFGHYAEVRRTTLGILQANDLEIIRKEAISSATEDLMLKTPGYWLAPCLVALAAWINDEQTLAQRAINEAVRRDVEKTALLFTLICRRAGRKEASLRWASLYLSTQSETELDRNSIIIIDAFTNGLLGRDSEGIVSKKLSEWLDKLRQTTDFEEQQLAQWTSALKLYTPHKEYKYPALKKYSTTWGDLQVALDNSNIHTEILGYFDSIFSTPNNTGSVIEKLDDTMYSLVENFDSDELQLKQDERYTELILEYNGDIDKAKRAMEVEKSAFDEKRDFSQLLTDVALKNKSVNGDIATQKYAIALSKEWIQTAYSDLIAKNRASFPMEVEYSVGGYSNKTSDGSDEEAHIDTYKQYMQDELVGRLAEIKDDKMGKNIGIAMIVLGVLLMIPMAIIGIAFSLMGAYIMYKAKQKNEANAIQREKVKQDHSEKTTNGVLLIRQIMAEVVDVKREIYKTDAKSEQVIDFFEQLSPEQYVGGVHGGTRRVRMDN